jgi:hypothetical protein
MRGTTANPARMEQARLEANMSRGDLAHALRRVTSNRLKATERGIRGWERGEYAPSDGVIPAYAIVTNKPLDFFYEWPEQSDDEADSSQPMTRDRERKLLNVGLAVEALVAPSLSTGGN